MEKVVKASQDVKTQTEIIDQVKELLADSKYHIVLHDLIVKELNKVIDSMSAPDFPAHDQHFTNVGFVERIAKYETITKDLRMMGTCIAYWGNENHHNILNMTCSRIAGLIQNTGGFTVWLTLRWYPVILMLYSIGVAALSAKKYANLATVFLTNVFDPDNPHGRIPLVQAVGKILLEINRSECFKYLPGREQQIYPREEHLFGQLQPELDNLLFLGRDYEEYFMQFEVFFALAHGHYYKISNGSFWAPSGWFFKRTLYSNEQDTFSRIIKEAELKRDKWEPIHKGLFPASYERFEEIVEDMKQLIRRRSF